MPSYPKAFIVGSKNFKKSAVEDHTKSKPYMKAYWLFLHSQGVALKKRAKYFSFNAGNESIVSGFLKKDPKDLSVIKIKFEVAYFGANNELPFSKYKEVLSLEKHHSVQMSDSYISDTVCYNFIGFIGLDLKDQLLKDLAKAKFFSVLSDWSTDSLLIENKIIYCLYFDPCPIGSDSVEVRCSFVSCKFLKGLSTDGFHTAISDTIKKKIELLGILSASNRLVGFTSDGASIN